jgi:flagellar protein FlaG
MATDLGINGIGVAFTAPDSFKGRGGELPHRLEAALQLATSDAAAGTAASPAEIKASASYINEVMRGYGLEFIVSDTGSRVVTRVMDRESGELIRQIPNDTVLRVAERLDEVVGVLFQGQAR